jgi:hypothetical protein
LSLLSDLSRIAMSGMSYAKAHPPIAVVPSSSNVIQLTPEPPFSKLSRNRPLISRTPFRQGATDGRWVKLRWVKLKR